jgi:aspartate carbamoyltransferase catalytic subunit
LLKSSYTSFIQSASIPLHALYALIEKAHQYSVLLESPAPVIAPSLAHRTVATMFYENSTRTRLSFEQAALHLGAKLLRFDVATSSVQKGETLEDTLDTLIAMGVNAAVLRHSESDIMPGLHQHLNGEVALISAGEGMRDHPTQGLLDALTLYQVAGCSFDALKTLRLAVVGDVKHSRVVPATLAWAHQLGVQLSMMAPPALHPPPSMLNDWRTRYSLQCFNTLDEVTLAQQDVVMALRLQKERLSTHESPEACEAIVKEFQLNQVRLDALQAIKGTGLKFMHPGPTNWGVELGHCLNYRHHPQSLIHRQVRNGVAVRMAVLEYCINGTVQEASRHVGY